MGYCGQSDPCLLLSRGEAANHTKFDAAGLITVFAHAWGPSGTTSIQPVWAFTGNIHADAKENWMTGMADSTAYNTQGGIDLETILLHELGHSLGLDHASGGYAEPGGSVMDALSKQALATLQADDIAGIRFL